MPMRKNQTIPWRNRYDPAQIQCRERSLAMTHGSMHMEREFRLAMTHESMHALEVRIHNLNQNLSLYPIAK